MGSILTGSASYHLNRFPLPGPAVWIGVIVRLF